MTDIKPKTSKPFSIRLTAAERADLERRAGKLALGVYARSWLLGSAVARRRAPAARPLKSPIADKAALSQALALLGKAGLARSLSTLSEAARLGTLPVTPETEAALRRACADIARIKTAVMRALGIAER